MEKGILFSEKQRFSQWWLWLILGAVNIALLSGMVQQLVLNKPFGKKPMNDSALLTTEILLFLITLLFLSFRLETQIRQDGVYVRFFPFHRKYKQYPWDRIRRAFVRRYKPVREYGGWGLRTGIFGNRGRALNMSGNMGLQLEFDNKRMLLIGTRKPEEIEKVLREMGKLKE
jgi:uncharacterized membrane protein YobD (UPF0266 family)